jgi:ribosomal protein S18 acetylase RimI-like enzyme
MNHITYTFNNSSESNIIEHLNKCDDFFIQKLSEKVNINEYSKKIYDNAMRLEAWNDKNLVGLIAFYENKKDRFMFITNVSIDIDFVGKGIAKKLMSSLIDIFNQEEYDSIYLEVDINNIKAIQLYKKFNFFIESQNNNNLKLKLKKI